MPTINVFSASFVEPGKWNFQKSKKYIFFRLFIIRQRDVGRAYTTTASTTTRQRVRRVRANQQTQITAV